ncbi:hypothetical protein LTR78_003823 [Recurvomyces mirabilis]|uniref:Uncharacterized protein n=1 Tax=Recurvomyces mirabilis TaxID=574656 RepID=A0AAE0WRL5_9PEZI|nr:hypothetical protein LTR78_003823 [Recurvomyces mirabilis]KAK5154935.1 hypothetical protein LTS14_006516 [Recurvomyces mirabilis]
MTNLGLRMTVHVAEVTSDRSYFLTLFRVDETADVYHLNRFAAPLYAAKRSLDNYKQDTIFVLRDFGQSWEFKNETEYVDPTTEGLIGSGDSAHSKPNSPGLARSETSLVGAKRRKL